MRTHFFIFINEENPQEQRELDNEGMQDFLIHQANVEGVLYHTQMPQIKIIYNFNSGEVKLVDAEQKSDISNKFTNAFRVQRGQVEEAIRRVAKLELLAELYKKEDSRICELIKHRHVGIDPSTGKIRSNTRELDLDMTLVQIIKFGYSNSKKMDLRRFFLHRKNHSEQTHVHKAIYQAFLEFKKLYSGSHGLDQLNSKHAVEQFIKLIDQYLINDKVQSQVYKKSSR